MSELIDAVSHSELTKLINNSDGIARVYLRLCAAYKSGRGVKLSWNDIDMLMLDDAISTHIDQLLADLVDKLGSGYMVR